VALLRNTFASTTISTLLYYESMVAAIEDDEFYLHHVHSMFQVCKHAIVDSWMASMDENKEDDHQSSFWDQEEMQRLVDGCWYLLTCHLFK
jgi:hypothetical protein